MPKSLADGHVKFTIVTTEPADVDSPTAVELNAGIDLSCDVLASDFVWSAADSDKVAEKALCDTNNANALGASNFQAGATLFRYFNATTGAIEATEDAGYTALKTKGTTVWGYVRKSGKLATDAWAAGDIADLGMEVLTDAPQDISGGGYIKKRIPMEPQRGWQDITVA